jgi:hypothetical protein
MRDIKNRRENLIDSPASRFPADAQSHPKDEVFVPCTGPPDRLGENSTAPGAKPVKRFVHHQKRDPETRAFQSVSLERVDAADRFVRIHEPDDLGKTSDAPVREFFCFRGIEPAFDQKPQFIGFRHPFDHRSSGHLADLLREGHPGEQILHSEIHGPIFLLVDREFYFFFSLHVFLASTGSRKSILFLALRQVYPLWQSSGERFSAWTAGIAEGILGKNPHIFLEIKKKLKKNRTF